MGDTRVKTAIPKNTAMLSGSLGDSLLMHAAQRPWYFFLFLFNYRALRDRLVEKHGLVLGEAEGVNVERATHQIATGQRTRGKAYYDFVDRDGDIVSKFATACGSRDAAHYCNLGVEASFLKKADAFARPGLDNIAFGLRNNLVVMAGATRELPQRVNIGPDRIVDQVHGRLAAAFLDGTAPLSPPRYQNYLETCRKDMRVYREKRESDGDLGLAACCDCYMAFYLGDPACKPPWDRWGVWRMLVSAVEAECAALGLDRDRYLSTLVR